MVSAFSREEDLNALEWRSSDEEEVRQLVEAARAFDVGDDRGGITIDPKTASSLPLRNNATVISGARVEDGDIGDRVYTRLGRVFPDEDFARDADFFLVVVRPENENSMVPAPIRGVVAVDPKTGKTVAINDANQWGLMISAAVPVPPSGAPETQSPGVNPPKEQPKAAPPPEAKYDAQKAQRSFGECFAQCMGGVPSWYYGIVSAACTACITAISTQLAAAPAAAAAAVATAGTSAAVQGVGTGIICAPCAISAGAVLLVCGVGCIVDAIAQAT